MIFFLHKYHECTCGILFLKIMSNYIFHTKINSLTIIHLIILRLFSFHNLLLKLNSSIGREDRQTKCNNTEHTLQLLDNNKGVIVFFLDFYTASN